MLSRRIKSLFSDSIYYGVGIFLMKGISLIMLPVYTHYLTPNDYGRLEVLVVFANVISIFLGFGLVEALYRFVGLAKTDQEQKKQAGQCLLLAFVIGVFALVTFLLFSTEIAALLPEGISHDEVLLMGIALAVGSVLNVPLAWLRFTDRARLFFTVTMVKMVLQVLLTFYGFTQGWGIISVLASTAISTVLVAIYLGHLQAKETGLHFSITSLKDILKYGWPIFVAGIASFALAGMDRWLLAEYFGADDVALYAIAMKFALVPILLIQPFTLWWYPKRFSVLSDQNGLKVNAHFAMVGASLAVVMCGGLGLVGPTLITWLTPESYHGAAGILPMLLLCTLLKLIAELLNLGCYVDKSSYTQMHINVFSSVVGAVLLMIWVPSYFINGAIYALVIAYAVRLLLFYVISQRRLKLPYQFGYLSSALGFAFIATYLGQYIEVAL